MPSSPRLHDLEPAFAAGVKKGRDIAVSWLESKGLLSLYLGGTIESDDRIDTSDIDLIGIVSDDFDFLDERDLNRFFGASVESVGFKARFRGLAIGELQGGPQVSFITQTLPIRLFIKRLPYFIFLWGQEADFSTFVPAYAPKEEAVVQVETIRSHIDRFKSERHLVFFSRVPKAVLYLSAVEAEAESGYDFDPSFEKLVAHLSDQPNHIAHQALEVRKLDDEVSEARIASFLGDVQEYIRQIEIDCSSWKS